MTTAPGRLAGRVLSLVFVGLTFLVTASCAVISGLPSVTTTEERLKAFPLKAAKLEKPVIIYWSKEQIPFIEAQSDHDAAYALGMVHGHLRLGQLALMRHISQGRLSELAGPIANVGEIDHALRIIDFGKTSRAVYAGMAAETRRFLDAFVEGLNHYQRSVENDLPHEFALAGISPEPWQAHELITIGRLASIDVTWFVWFRLMGLRDRPDWPALWRKALDGGSASVPSFGGGKQAALGQLQELLAATPRTGSNSFAVNGKNSASGAALIATDPHLGLNLPAVWLLAGVKSPGYHMVGIMIPGLPFVAVGRNADIAWGGTNLRSSASDLVDVSHLKPEEIRMRQERLTTRLWFGRDITIRETPYGPILSDAALVPKREGETFAIKWIGHTPSDEVGAMLAMNRAKNWDEFRTALDGFSISAQNFIYADRHGNIGHLIATHIPARPKTLPADIVRPVSDMEVWNRILTARDLPQAYNPDSGFVASANNKPAETEHPIGYFFSGDDRVSRMQALLKGRNGMTVADMAKIQTDTFMASASLLRDALLARAEDAGGLSAGAEAAREVLKGWNGRFDVKERGPVAFQGAVATLAPLLADEGERAVIDAGGNEYEDYAALLKAMPKADADSATRAALEAAAKALAGFPDWGAMHRLNVKHNFGMIPVIGGRYAFGDMPWPGSTDTLWRAGHPLKAEKMYTGFGANARHISDMGDPDANWFVLLGGNDGWINSANFLDQVESFRDGRMVQIPMRLETVRARFPHRMILVP